MRSQKNHGEQRHGSDQGQLPKRNRSDIQETPEQDISTQPRQRGEENPNLAGQQDQKDNRDSGQGRIGGQGMGQGRGMNPGEGSKSEPGQGEIEPMKGDLEPDDADTDDADIDALDEAFNGKPSITQPRHHRAGEDPALPVDPNAEDASLATDEQGIGKVARLRREAHTEAAGGDLDETSEKVPAIANDDSRKKSRK